MDFKGPQVEIVKFLYQFKDDNKFYSLNDTLLNVQQQQEVYYSIHTLRDKALIATDREFHFNSDDNSLVDHFNNTNEIKAKILPKGVVAIETMLRQEHAN